MTDRYDPYRNFRFRVKWDRSYVAGVSKVSGLSRTTEVIAHRAGRDPSTPRPVPGQSDFAPITLERGVTYDVAFEQWANKVWDYRNATGDDLPGAFGEPDLSLQDFRKDLVLEVYNEAGQKVLAWTIRRCWASEFVWMPELDGIGNAVVIETLVLQHEGWECDTSLAGPADPGFTLDP